MKQNILQMMFTLALCASAQGQSFSDDFNRPDSPSAGNGWLNAIDNRPGAQLGIVSNRLSAASMSYAAVYRPFPTANQVVLSAVITDQNGYYCGNFRLRYQVSFAIRNDGTMNGGYGIHFNRADQNYPSGVTLSDNGVNIASTNSSFQFGYSLTINYVVFNPDGSVQGRITGDGNTFDFSFPARTINSQGNNISINIPDGTACPNGIVSTVDNFKIAQAPTIISTNRTPLNSAIGSPTIPTDPTHFKVFTNGIFTNGIPLDPSKMTVVMTHGLNGSPSDWAEYMAQIIRQRIGANTVNLVAWDWSAEAHTNVWDVGIIARKTPGQGFALGTNLIAALGANYSRPIHFVGHSLGTLVNAAAANYLETNGYSWANIQMTLCDDAEIAWGGSGNKLQFSTTLPYTIYQDGKTLFSVCGNSSSPQPLWGSPLPKQCAWADNYVSAVGQLHPEAANAILTFTSISDSPDWDTWLQGFFNFHDYSHYFYEDTIEPGIFNTGGQINATYMGFICSSEAGGIAQRPAANTFFYQDPNGLELNLVQTNLAFATNFLNERFNSYLGTLASSVSGLPLDGVVQAAGQVTGSIDNIGNMVINLITSIGSGLLVQNSARPLGGPIPNDGSANDTPAYAWIPLAVPSNAISMSFDFMLQGNGNNDSFQAALNGTNVLSLETTLIQTNVTMNSGFIDVSQYAGTNVELFLGIVGGTSTNAQLMVSDIQFFSAVLPSLRAQVSSNNIAVTWPLSAQNFSLQTTTNLADPNSWTTLPNVPAIVNLQNAVTNPVSGGAMFYRLKK